MRCLHIRFDNLSGTSCTVTGASVSADCGALRERCAPMLALDVREGRLALDEIPSPMNGAVRSVLIQLGGLEPEIRVVPMGKPRVCVPRNRGRKKGKGRGRWTWSPEQRAKLAETKRKWWADRRAAR